MNFSFVNFIGGVEVNIILMSHDEKSLCLAHPDRFFRTKPVIQDGKKIYYGHLINNKHWMNLYLLVIYS